MSSQCLATTWNIAFSTSPKSNFGLVKRQKMTFKCNSTAWIVSLSTWKKSLFRLIRSRKWLLSAIRQLESSLFRLDPNDILGSSRGRKRARRSLQPLEKLLFLPKSHCRLVQTPKKSWKSHVSPWNIDFSISNNSHFSMVKRPKMSSKWHGSPWNIAFSTST